MYDRCMTLSEYLKEEKITQLDFAKENNACVKVHLDRVSDIADMHNPIISPSNTRVFVEDAINFVRIVDLPQNIFEHVSTPTFFIEK